MFWSASFGSVSSNVLRLLRQGRYITIVARNENDVLYIISPLQSILLWKYCRSVVGISQYSILLRGDHRRPAPFVLVRMTVFLLKLDIHSSFNNIDTTGKIFVICRRYFDSDQEEVMRDSRACTHRHSPMVHLCSTPGLDPVPFWHRQSVRTSP